MCDLDGDGAGCAIAFLAAIFLVGACLGFTFGASVTEGPAFAEGYCTGLGLAHGTLQGQDVCLGGAEVVHVQKGKQP